MRGPKTEERSFTQDEFAQFAIDKIERAEGRIKGFHFVLNALANELRNSDPTAAQRVSSMIEQSALDTSLSDDTREIVAMYVGILSHGSIPPPEEQQ